ncbi:MAG: PAN domain-containing protein [Nitrospira sp.]|nr:PAN domain-containing protein [Nitrospira sp.]
MVKWKVLLALFLAVGIAGCAAQHFDHSAEAESSSTTIPSTMIMMEQPVHFATIDGGAVVVEPDEYRVEQTTESQLRLVPQKGDRPFLLAAALTTHDIEVSKPFPLLLALNEDARNLVLLLPDGTALDAAGSLSGIQSRDLVRPRRHYHLAYQLDQTTGQVQFGDGVAGQRPPASPSQAMSRSRVGAGALSTVGTVQRESELEMINLQSLLSQRQQIVQLTTNITAAQNEPFHLEYNTDRPGGDFGHRTTVSPEACRVICSADNTCQAFTFVKPPAGTSAGQCYLKRAVPAQTGNPCCISAKRKSVQEELVGNIGK